jgi:DNA-directed RNA polymerase subunit RPC12/RpoP
MGKIQDYVVKNGVKPKECVYHTWRDAKNAKNEPTGKIRILVPPHSTTAMVEYTCPECKHAGYKEQEWKRPFKMKCDKCNFMITVPKMKAEAKREAKAANAKKN